MSEFPSWSLIESDPGVFSELISKMGVKGVQVEEIWCMDAFSIKQLSPVYGLIFLFKWESARQVASGEIYDSSSESGVYFAQQIVPNACATQAILSVLMNAVDIDLGDELQSFKSFTEDFPADLKGEMIGNSDLLRTVHNSFSNPNNFISERLSERCKGGESEDLFHFVAFMPINGHLYELDGLKTSPHKIEPCTDDDWIDRALDSIQNRINSYGGGEVRFSLMAVCADRVMALQAQVDQIKEGLMEFYDPTTKSNVSRQDMSAMDIRLDALQEEILNEEAKQNKWKKENSLRRHNFIPLFMQLLAEASRSGRLGPMVKKACGKK